MAVFGFQKKKNNWIVLTILATFLMFLQSRLASPMVQPISRAAKLLLDRDAQISAILTSTDYRRSPLVQGGLEIACKVIVKLPGTVRNHLLMDRYVEIVKVNYIEPKHEVILGSFLKKSSTAAQPTNKKRNTSNTNNPKKKQKPNHDIRSLFRRAEERTNEEQTTGVNSKSDKQYHEVINIDYKLYLAVYICES